MSEFLASFDVFQVGFRIKSRDYTLLVSLRVAFHLGR